MSLKKNISSSNEDTQLLSVFQAHFTDFLNLARIRLICLFISSLCKVRSVNFSKLSSGFDNNVAASSNYRRIQRFIAEVELPSSVTACNDVKFFVIHMMRIYKLFLLFFQLIFSETDCVSISPDSQIYPTFQYEQSKVK